MVLYFCATKINAIILLGEAQNIEEWRAMPCRHGEKTENDIVVGVFAAQFTGVKGYFGNPE